MVEQLLRQANDGGPIPPMDALVDAKTTIACLSEMAHGVPLKTEWRKPRRFESCSTQIDRPKNGFFRNGLVVRIFGFHPKGPGSIPGCGTIASTARNGLIV